METISSKETERFSYIAFFDLDHTLTGAVSGTELARRAWKKGVMKLYDLLHALFLSAEYRLGIKDPVKAVYEMAGWVKGVRVRDLEILCEEVLNNIVIPMIYEEAPVEINIHKERNAKTVILSSSLEPICREVALYLQMDDVICSRLESADGILTGRPVGNLCFGDEKLSRVRVYCEKNNSALSDCWYYADSFSDLPVLSNIGHPVCINPEKKLASAARKNGWTINYWSVRVK